jgi:metallophosphoesterase superfamily enzyme
MLNKKNRKVYSVSLGIYSVHRIIKNGQVKIRINKIQPQKFKKIPRFEKLSRKNDPL